MFCATLLKETCVAAYLIGWVAGALAVSGSERKLAWAAFGVYCGLGVALRSTLVLLCLPALLLPAMAGWMNSGNGAGGNGAADRSSALRPAPAWVSTTSILGVSLVLSLVPWSMRNFIAFGGLSPLPHNGGIVLYQIYNADNPRSAIWIPPFVDYSNPSEIWRGFAAEANRRTGPGLSPPEVDRYWRDQAQLFIRDHPGQVLEDVAHKSLLFLADTEVPNNRSSDEERLFSPILALLPRPTAWLLGMGLAGLAGIALRDRRWLLLAAPIAVSAGTFVCFWAEDRFRFHAAPELALCSGLWLDGLLRAVRSLRERRAPVPRQPGAPALPAAPLPPAVPLLLAVLIGSTSWLLGTRFPPPPLRFDHVVWGYIKMGRLAEARRVAERAVKEQPDNAPVLEALGYLSAVDRRYADAARSFERAIALRPRSYVAHYNLAKAYLALGERSKATDEARAALGLNPTRDASDLLRQLQGGS
jgi:tetratricopeptide (TPR) repeat protein